MDCTGKRGLYINARGKMLLNGKLFYGAGVNFYDLFVSAFSRNWDMTVSLNAMETLKGYDCKVIRFSTTPFYHSEYRYFEDTENYWKAMDKVVQKAEELDMGLLPSLFWTNSLCDYLDEPYNAAFLNPSSKTVEFTKRYVSDFVRRYEHSAAIYGWEYSNERILSSDHPTQTHLPPLPPGSRRKGRDCDDVITLDGLEAMYKLFASAVKFNDRYCRIISTGDTNPRESSFNQYKRGLVQNDTHSEHEFVLDKINPPGITALSQHQYSHGIFPNPGARTWPLLDYFNDWESFFKYLIEMSEKRKIATYAGEVGYMCTDASYFPKLTVEDTVVAFREAAKAALKTGMQLILFWNYDPVTEPLSPDCVFDRGTGIEYSFSHKSGRGRRILEIMRDTNKEFAARQEGGHGNPDKELVTAL